MRSRQRNHLMSRLSPSGKSLTNSISSSPPMVAHLWRSNWRTLCRNWDGNCLRLIHHSRSRHFSCMFLFFAITTCKNTFISILIVNNTISTSCELKFSYGLLPEYFQSTEWIALNHWTQYICWKSLRTTDLWVLSHSRKCCNRKKKKAAN